VALAALLVAGIFSVLGLGNLGLGSVGFDRLGLGDAKAVSAPLLVSDPPATARPARTFTTADFNLDWDPTLLAYGPTIVAGVNRVSHDNPDCLSPDPSSVGVSRRRSVPGNPVFFVTCSDPQGHFFNARFTASDVAGGRLLAPPPVLQRPQAIAACRDAARARSGNPSTFNFSVLRAEFEGSPADGRAAVSSRFAAANRFGVTVDYSVQCYFDGQDLTGIDVSGGPFE
jgi:hypothetical protein